MSKQRLGASAVVICYMEVPQVCTRPEKTFSLSNMSLETCQGESKCASCGVSRLVHPCLWYLIYLCLRKGAIKRIIVHIFILQPCLYCFKTKSTHTPRPKRECRPGAMRQYTSNEACNYTSMVGPHSIEITQRIHSIQKTHSGYLRHGSKRR